MEQLKNCLCESHINVKGGHIIYERTRNSLRVAEKATLTIEKI